MATRRGSGLRKVIRMSVRSRWCAALALTAALSVSMCGGGSSSPASPSPAPAPAPTPAPAPAPAPAPSPSPAPSDATITISASGAVSPKTLTVAVGTRVTFVNNDSRAHDMASDPHPDHTDCPELNQVGFLTSGQSRQTGNLNTARSCGFHDHNQPSNGALTGTIVIR